MRNTANQMLTHQIAIELDKLNSIVTDENDKPAIMQRIADLKAMLDVPVCAVEESQPTAREMLCDFIDAFRRR